MKTSTSRSELAQWTLAVLLVMAGVVAWQLGGSHPAAAQVADSTQGGGDCSGAGN